MLGYFPPPRKDESFYSLIARFVSRMDWTAAATNKNLFGSYGANQYKPIPSKLFHLISVVPTINELTIERLIYEHTALPYHYPFLPVSTQRIIIETIPLNRGGLNLNKLAGIETSGIPLPNYVRYCPLCVQDDVSSRGETYWRRMHQIAGFEICLKHNTLLADSSLSRKDTAIEYVPPNDNNTNQSCKFSKVDQSNQFHRILVDIATDIDWLLKNKVNVENSERVNQRYKILLYDRGLSSYRGKVKFKTLYVQFFKKYDNSLLKYLGCPLDPESTNNWLVQLLKETGKSLNPIRHLLFIRFLGYGVEEFLKLPHERKPFGLGPWACLNPFCKYYKKPLIRTFDLRFSNDGVVKPIASFHCICGFTYEVKWKGERTQPDTHCILVKQFGRGWEDGFRNLWMDPATTLTDIKRFIGFDHKRTIRKASELGLDIPRKGPRKKSIQVNTLKTIVATTDERMTKTRGREVVKLSMKPNEKPEGRLCYNRSREAYRWLLKNDRRWLDRFLGRGEKRLRAKESRNRQTIDWGERDTHFSNTITKTAKTMKSSTDYPRRITKCLLIREAKLGWIIGKNGQKLPRTTVAIRKAAESRKDYLQRKILWAAEQYSNEGKRPKEWELLCRVSMVARHYREMPSTKQALDAISTTGLIRK